MENFLRRIHVDGNQSGSSMNDKTLGWSGPDNENCIVDFTNPPPSRKEKPDHGMLHKKFYNDFGDLFSTTQYKPNGSKSSN
uniref:Uncharacterized protein n=1 Tax=Panagrolaimus sp. JU765 TaxID=591449 RepID=A0AC34R2F8_9BILA